MTRASGLAVTTAALLWSLAGPASAQLLLNGPTGPSKVPVVSYRDLPFRTVVRQQYDYSCGSAALATLLRHHYGRDVTERQVFETMFATGDQAQIQRVGFSLLDMKRFLEAHGFSGDGFRLGLGDLIERGAPAIVLVNNGGYRHFVVFKGVDDRNVLIGDPALGLKIYSHEAFHEMWNGVAFMIHDAGGHFNQEGEWKPWATAPMRDAMPPSSLAALTQQLPPLYQISTRFSLDSVLR